MCAKFRKWKIPPLSFLLRDFSTDDESTTSGINDGGWGALRVAGRWDEALEATRLKRNSSGALERQRMETVQLSLFPCQTQAAPKGR